MLFLLGRNKHCYKSQHLLPHVSPLWGSSTCSCGGKVSFRLSRWPSWAGSGVWSLLRPIAGQNRGTFGDNLDLRGHLPSACPPARWTVMTGVTACKPVAAAGISWWEWPDEKRKTLQTDEISKSLFLSVFTVLPGSLEVCENKRHLVSVFEKQSRAVASVRDNASQPERGPRLHFHLHPWCPFGPSHCLLTQLCCLGPSAMLDPQPPRLKPRRICLCRKEPRSWRLNGEGAAIPAPAAAFLPPPHLAYLCLFLK